MGKMDAPVPQDLRERTQQTGTITHHHMRTIARFIARLLRTIFELCTTRNARKPKYVSITQDRP
jgi:transposase